MNDRTHTNILAVFGLGLIAFYFGAAYVVLHFVVKFW